MNRTGLHVIQGKSANRRRLCDTCTGAVVMRSAGVPDDEVFCLFVNRGVSIDITRCNRYSEREGGPGCGAQVCESAWVA